MATTEMNCLAGGGGGGANGTTVYVNGSEVSSVTTSLTEFVVKTGLSSIDHFCLVAKDANSGSYKHIVEYVQDDVSDKYTAIVAYDSDSAYVSNNYAFNTRNSGNTSTMIKSISGGDVTLVSGRNQYGQLTNGIYWWAD